MTDPEARLGRTYPQRDDCAQYREPDFNFVSRLMEEEGIYSMPVAGIPRSGPTRRAPTEGYRATSAIGPLLLRHSSRNASAGVSLRAFHAG
ncbi:contractile injection system protein, VgrG/Pvc8 family [Methylocaldum marinum]|uniref:contractile injection system protein, VgrG/Pvc8 family n=1 Tax=Methylocaldum marinum TaxID=1432792 RepID=UPI000E68C6A4